MDQFEKFIKENSAAFDTAIPDLKVWGEIDKRLPEKKVKQFNFRKTFSIAASLLVLIIAGSMFFSGKWQKNNAEEMNLAKLPHEYTETIDYYRKQIEIKKAVLTKYHPDETVIDDIDNLDSSFAELKKELANAPHGAEKEILKALINNYRTKLNILELVLEKAENCLLYTSPSPRD